MMRSPAPPGPVLHANPERKMSAALWIAFRLLPVSKSVRHRRVDPSWKKGRRRFERRTWDVFALSLLPLPPTLLLLGLTYRDHERICPPAKIAVALAVICILATIYLFVRLIQIARAAAARRLLMTANDLALLGTVVAIGSAAYISIAKNLLWRGCL